MKPVDIFFIDVRGHWMRVLTHHLIQWPLSFMKQKEGACMFKKEKLLTVEEVARRLRVSTSTVWKLISQGVLTTVKVLGKRAHLVEKSEFLEEELLTIGEVARRVRTSKSSVWKWIKQGALQAIPLPGVYRVKESELLAFVKSNGMPPHLRQENLWATNEIADWLRVDDTTVVRWINQRKFPIIQVDGIRGYRIKETDLLAFLGRNEILPEDEKVLTTNEISDWLQIDSSTLMRWIKQKKLPAIIFPGGYRVLESDLETFLGMPDGILWQEKLLSLSEIAHRMGVDRGTIQRWVKQGKLPAIIFPGEHRVLESAFDAFIERWKG
jgi:excisionase family DNA binding protein